MSLPESGANAGRGDMKKAPAIGCVFVAPGFGCIFRAAAATVSIEFTNSDGGRITG